MIMGMIHGITNLGGALLSAIVFSKDLSKDFWNYVENKYAVN